MSLMTQLPSMILLSSMIPAAFDDSTIFDDTIVFNDATVLDDTIVFADPTAFDDATIFTDTRSL